MFSAWVQKWINQIAHVGWGLALTLALGLHINFFFAIVGVFLFASVKEAVFDPITETVAEQGSGWQDWAFWLLGIALAILAVAI